MSDKDIQQKIEETWKNEMVSNENDYLLSYKHTFAKVALDLIFFGQQIKSEEVKGMLLEKWNITTKAFDGLGSTEEMSANLAIRTAFMEIYDDLSSNHLESE